MSQSSREFAAARAYLLSHSADLVAHPGGTLMKHLNGTCELLRAWNTPAEICLAGLCHTAYGTDGWPNTMEDPARRGKLTDIIGPDGEQLVYFYAACDRAWLYPQLAPGALVGIHDLERAREVQRNIPASITGETAITFRDRFSGNVFVPSPDVYAAFLELTFANELEIIRARWTQISERNRIMWQALFEACRKHVSEAAYDCYRETFQLGRCA
ncbi:MAG: hypothetical protein HY290_08205 [Planctomycetia bacterium]|nr:hypothetical protein [Planctomycetia bacterium]